MLGIRLKPEEEALLDRHARALGRPKSALAREWIRERLDRESTDAKIRRAAEFIAGHERNRDLTIARGATDAYLRMLDELDGGYDWGPEGPPE